MKYFIYIVFDDPEVVGVLDFLVEVMNGRKWRSLPHLTIQGPLDSKPNSDLIESIKNRLSSDDFLIANPGIFETKSGVALYLNVTSPNLKKVWNKPDFPIEKYGFNPHLTIYEGPDIEKAQKAYHFLRSGLYRIELICRQYSVVPYASKQFELFPVHEVKGNENAISRLIGLGKVSSSFRASFMQAINT